MRAGRDAELAEAESDAVIWLDALIRVVSPYARILTWSGARQVGETLEQARRVRDRIVELRAVVIADDTDTAREAMRRALSGGRMA